MKSTVDARRTVGWIASLGLAAVTMLVAPQAHATSLPLGTASDYAVLFEGFCGHTVQIGSNVTINGNIGVGGGPASGFGTFTTAARVPSPGGLILCRQAV